MEKLCTTRTPYYLQQWIAVFYCHVDQIQKEKFGNAVQSEDDRSIGTFDTEDKDTDEYLIDIYEGIDIYIYMM